MQDECRDLASYFLLPVLVPLYFHRALHRDLVPALHRDLVPVLGFVPDHGHVGCDPGLLALWLVA